MEQTTRTRIHPMMAVAAASVALVSLVGAASIAGLLPNLQAKQNDAVPPVVAERMRNTTVTTKTD